MPNAQRVDPGTAATLGPTTPASSITSRSRHGDPKVLTVRLRQAGLPVLERYIASAGLFQSLVAAPDGLMIGLNFADMADRPGWSMASQL